jgi:hypothetical protein
MPDWRIRMPIAAFLVLSWAAFISPSPAIAQRGCFEGNPNMKCPLADCAHLQNDVDFLCGLPRACKNVVGCDALRAESQHWLDCGNARKAINTECFIVVDLEHQQKEAEAFDHVAKCKALIAQPPPVGCDDPCP